MAKQIAILPCCKNRLTSSIQLILWRLTLEFVISRYFTLGAGAHRLHPDGNNFLVVAAVAAL